MDIHERVSELAARLSKLEQMLSDLGLVQQYQELQQQKVQAAAAAQFQAPSDGSVSTLPPSDGSAQGEAAPAFAAG